ncbi:MAG: hypothetical protein AMXMBFR7_09550 [Planctomycetota bacterium]
MPELKLSRTDFEDLLRSVKRVRKLIEKDDAVLTFDGQQLKVTMKGLTVSMPAEGAWDGQARVVAKFLIGLIGTKVKGETVSIRIDQGLISANGMSIKCVWSEGQSRQAILPFGATLPYLLQFAEKYTAEEIEQAGLTEKVATAKARRDQLMDQAIKCLEELGISESRLREFVDVQIRRTNDA